MLPILLLLCQSGGLAAAMDAAAKQAAAGDYKAAAATLEQAGAGKSDDATALTAYGTYLLRDAEARAASGQGQGLDVADAFSSAADVLRKAAAAKNAPPEAFVNWSEALINTDDLRNAEKATDTGLQKHPDDLALLLQKGRVLTTRASKSTGDKQKEAYAGAMAAYRKARDKFPKGTDSCVRLGELEVLQGQIADQDKHMQEAQAQWREALQRDPGAVDLNAMGQWLGNDAAADLMAAVNQGAEEPTRLWYQGKFELGATPPRWEAARQHLERVMELNPAFTNTWYLLATGAMAEGARLQQAGQTDPAERAYLYAASAWARYLKDFGANQIQGMASAEDKGQGFLEQVRWLEGKAIGGGRAADAAQLARWRTQARPQDAEAWNNLGFFLREAAQYEESLAAYRKALDLSPDDPGLLNDTAVILHYYLKRDDAEALSLYQKAQAKAQAILDQPAGRSEEELQNVRTALRDSTNNLKKLQAGNRDNG